MTACLSTEAIRPAHTRVMAQTEIRKRRRGLRSWFSALAELWLLLELESPCFHSSVSVLLLPYLRTYLRTNLPAKYTDLRCLPNLMHLLYSPNWQGKNMSFTEKPGSWEKPHWHREPWEGLAPNEVTELSTSLLHQLLQKTEQRRDCLLSHTRVLTNKLCDE